MSAPPGPRGWSAEVGDFSEIEDFETLSVGEEAAKVVEHLPFGVLVFDPEQNLRFANREHALLLGRDLRETGSMETWMRAGCRDARYADKVIQAWREHVWQKQLTRVFSLKNADDQMREIEFRPRLLDNGDLLVTLLDVTHSRQAEDALRATETKFGAVFQQVESGIALIDRTGRFLDVNPAFEERLGYSRAELRRMALNDCVAFTDIERVRAAETAMAIREGQGTDSTRLIRHEFTDEEAIRFRPREGDVFPAEVTLSLVLGPQGQKLYTVLFLRSGVEGGRHFEASQARNRALLEAIPDLILVLGADGTIEDVMPANGGDWRGVVATPDWKGGNVSACWPAFDARMTGRVKEAIEGGKLRSWRFSEPANDGGESSGRSVHYSVRVAPCENDGAVVVVMDVTEEVEAREALVRQGLAFQHLEEGIIVTNLRGRIVDWNAAAERLFGYSLNEIAGSGLAKLYAAPEEAVALNAEISRALSETGRWQSRRTFYRKDGTTGEAEVWFLPVESAGAPRSLLGIHREVTADPALDDEIGERMQHRWRNQLQAVSGLLSLEMSGEPGTNGDGPGGGMDPLLLYKVQGRIKAIGRLHEMGSTLDAPIALADYTRILNRDLRRMVAGLEERTSGLTLEFRPSDDEGEVVVDFETATTFGFLITELALAVMTYRHQPEGYAVQSGAMILQMFEGYPLMQANVPSGVMSVISLPILKCLVDQLRGSLKVNHREGRAEWVLRFPPHH